MLQYLLIFNLLPSGPTINIWPQATTNYVRPLAAQDLWLAQMASQILIAGPEGQQKFADIEMQPQLSGYLIIFLITQFMLKQQLINYRTYNHYVITNKM